MPLISFGGETPLGANRGQPAKHAPVTTLPPPTATFLPEAVEAPSSRRTKIIAIIAILVVIAIVVVVLIAR